MKLFLLFIFVCGARAKGIAEEAETTLVCETDTCQNGGLCTTDGKGGHWCTCPHGFWGVYCEKEFTYAASKEDCHCKNGLCVEENGKLKCVCYSEFGLYKEYECKACNCGPGANCTIDRGIFSDDILCICPKGYKVKGERCIAIDPCLSNPCQHGGSCNRDGIEYTCKCPPGYYGNNCENEDCRCKNGVCVEENGNLTCVCNSEFGLYSEKECKACNCGSGANCTFEKGLFSDEIVCICPTGFEVKGGKCFPIDQCLSNPCQNGGSCDSHQTEYKCQCPPGYYGVNCEKKNCHCKNGFCVEENGASKCICNSEFGLYKENECKACNCGKGANCTFYKGIFFDEISCICPEGYKVSGEKCILSTINTRTESYFGTSEQSNMDSQLTTAGRDSSEFTRASTRDPYASSHQHLFSTDGVSSTFPSTTSGYQTTLDCGCQNGLCTIDIYGNLNCICNPQYAKNGRGMCTPCFCGQDANCEFVTRGGSIQKRCFCPEGYEDTNGYCTDINECLFSRTCPKNTKCQNTEGSYDCFCREGYRPNNRTSNVKYDGCVAVCNSTICKNGECQVDGYSYFCKCDNGFTGRRCEEKISDNRIIDIIEIQSPWIILSALLLIIFLAFIFIHRNKSVKKNTFIFSSADDKCPLFEDPKFVNRLQTEILE